MRLHVEGLRDNARKTRQGPETGDEAAKCKPFSRLFVIYEKIQQSLHADI